jgi:dihydrofolate reductase
LRAGARDVVLRLTDEFEAWPRSLLEIRREETSMRTLAITQNVTLDGSIEMLGDWFDPQAQAGVDNSDLLNELHRQDSRADAFLTGRRTFEDLRGYWPQRADDSTGISDYLNRVQKYVVSSTLTDPQWQNSTVLSGDPVDEVRALKEQPGHDIVVTGSITLCHTLIEAGLVDEYRLFVYPVVQGRGRRLFPDGFECAQLRVLEAKAFRSGITYSRYARA